MDYGYLDKIIAQSESKVANYDRTKYREEIGNAADKYGINYMDFNEPDNFGGGTNNKSKMPYIIGAVVLLAIGTGVFFYIKKKHKK